MRSIIFILIQIIFLPSISAQNITSQELSKLSSEINAVQIAADGKTIIDPDDKSSVVITFPRESFTVFFSSGFASLAVYKDGGTDQLFVTENIDFSKATSPRFVSSRNDTILNNSLDNQ